MSSSSDSDSEGSPWIPLSQRPEWSDVSPLPQDDGPSPVVPILYTPQFRETMDYFRSVLAMDERSRRSLLLTEEVINLNAGNYTVWHFRRLILESLSYDLWEEMEFIEKLAQSNYKNYQIWHHRRWAAEILGPAAKERELSFTEIVFIDDAKNYHAWSHRQWALKALGGWESELDFCAHLLQEDIYNNSAWNQRYFVIKNSPFHGGVESVRDSELKYCEEAIALDAANESPWRYLKGLFKGDNVALVKNKAVVNVCMQELRKNSDCIFALDLSLDLILLGCAASHRDLCELFGLHVETSNPLDVASFICTRLKEIDPMRTLYWSWRQATLPSTLSGGVDN